VTKRAQAKTAVVDLSEINPTLASKILRERRVSLPFATKRGLTAPPKRERVQKQLDDFRDAVNSTLRSLLKISILNSVFSAGTLIILLAAVVWSNLSGILAAVGITGTNAFAQAKAWQNTIIVYLQDASKLRASVQVLQTQYDGCGGSNEDECLDKVSKAIEAKIQQLENASKS